MSSNKLRDVNLDREVRVELCEIHSASHRDDTVRVTYTNHFLQPLQRIPVFLDRPRSGQLPPDGEPFGLTPYEPLYFRQDPWGTHRESGGRYV